MKTCIIKLIIIPSLVIFLCLINPSSSNSCKPMSCPRSSNSSVSTDYVSVHSPFRLKPMQGKYCGYAGFDLYCSDTLGTLIQFPNGVVLHVDDIYYNEEVLILSDPYDHCLSQKLLSLYLLDTPFHPANGTLFFTKMFWLYECSDYGSYDYSSYDRIDCQSESSYTAIISANFDITGFFPLYVCKFLKNLTVSTFQPSSSLSSISSIALTWSGLQEPRSPNSRHSYRNYFGPPVSLIVPLLGFLIPFTIMLCCLFRCWCRRNAQANTSVMNYQSRVALGTTTYAVTGLDQVTIDSYPVIVVGASGRLIKPDDTTCPICLSDYCPQETLKILPECIHRFHADCIDEWLRSKGVCPICRTSTPQTSSNH